MAYQNAKQAGQGGGGSGNAQDKLSKVSDDTANGLITFLKGIKIGLQRLFGWDAEGNITANDISARILDVERFSAEKFQAEEAQLNTVRSDNYNYDNGMNGTGFILTKWGTGDGVRSFMAIDDLMVRGKMTVNQLEIREETYTGGNQHWSPAGSVIFRVDYLDEDGQPLGFQTVNAPWLLNGEAFFTSSAQIAYATRQQVRELIGERINEVVTFRCYIVADNGTTSTRNFWCIGDQARCQTYNIVSRDRRDGEGEPTVGSIQTIDPLANIPISQKDGEKTMENVYYWRLVVGVGTAELEDGKTYNYIDLPNKDVYENGVLVKKMFAVGSDIPATGDTLVCFGNDRNRDRMGIVSIETYNGANESISSIDETPAIKMYAGVNKFSTNGNRTGIISPGKVEFDTAVFRLVTHSGSKTPIPNPRGAWAQNTAYFYYDVVQHNGSSWLCVVSDEYVWVEDEWDINDAFWQDISSKVVHPYNEGMLNDGESGYQGSKGHEIGHSENIWTLVQKYTTAEPSSSSQLWTLYASKGNDGTRGNFKSRVFCRTNDTPATPVNTTPQGTTYNTYNNPVPPPSGSQGQYVWTDGIPTNSDAQIWSTICTFYGGGGNSGWSTPATESDTADLDLEFSLSESETPPFAPSGNTPHSDHSSEGWYDPSLNQTLPSEKTWGDMIWRAERKIKNGEFEGNWVISRIKGEKGDDGQISPEDKQEIIAEIESELPSGITVVFDPNVIIVDQTDVAEFDKTGGINRSKLTVYKNGVLADFSVSCDVEHGYTVPCTGGSASLYSSATGNLRPLASYNQVYVGLDSIDIKQGTQSSDYDYAYDNGKITLTVSIDGKSYALSIKWYLNRLGRRITETKGDIEKTTMSRTEYALMEQTDNLLLNTKNPQSGDGTSGTWQVGSGTSLSTITDTDSPVDGYNKAFRISSTSDYLSQTHDFWKKTDTYKFGAYARCVSSTASATAQAQVRVIESSSIRFNRTVAVGTSWTYISFTVDIPQYNEATGTAKFQLGSNSGTVEFIAPILTLVNNTSVIRTDYMGEINSSAAGLQQDYNQKISAVNDKFGNYVTTEYMGHYEQSATENMARLETKIPDSNLLDFAGWQYYNGTLANYDDSEQSVFDDRTTAKAFVSHAVYLRKDVTYVFSLYYNPNAFAVYALKCNGNPDIIPNQVTAANRTKITLTAIQSDTFMSNTRYYGTFTPASDDYYKIQVSNSAILYRPQLEIGEEPTKWGAGAKNYSSEIKQTSTSISLSLKSDIEGELSDTGIDIENGEIDIKADKFTVRNNDDEHVLGVDANGDFEVSGTVRAKNLYHNICLIPQTGRYSTNCYYVYNTDDDWVQEQGYHVGDYILDYPDDISGITGIWACTYDADIVVMIPNNINLEWTSSSNKCTLPAPSLFKGKMVEVHLRGEKGVNGIITCVETNKFILSAKYVNGVITEYNGAGPFDYVEVSLKYAVDAYRLNNGGAYVSVGKIWGGGKRTLYSDGSHWIVIE